MTNNFLINCQSLAHQFLGKGRVNVNSLLIKSIVNGSVSALKDAKITLFGTKSYTTIDFGPKVIPPKIWYTIAFGPKSIPLQLLKSYTTIAFGQKLYQHILVHYSFWAKSYTTIAFGQNLYQKIYTTKKKYSTIAFGPKAIPLQILAQKLYHMAQKLYHYSFWAKSYTTIDCGQKAIPPGQKSIPLQLLDQKLQKAIVVQLLGGRPKSYTAIAFVTKAIVVQLLDNIYTKQTIPCCPK